MTDFPLSYSTEIVFHNTEYILSYNVLLGSDGARRSPSRKGENGDKLVIEIEDKGTGDSWSSEFSAQCMYILYCTTD